MCATNSVVPSIHTWPPPGQSMKETSFVFSARGITAPGGHSDLWRKLAPRKPQLRIGSAHPCFRQAKLAADDIGALDQRHALVERDAPRQALAAEAAIGRDDEAFLRDVFERLADQRRDLLGRLDHGVAVI